MTYNRNSNSLPMFSRMGNSKMSLRTLCDVTGSQILNEVAVKQEIIHMHACVGDRIVILTALLIFSRTELKDVTENGAMLT